VLGLMAEGWSNAVIAHRLWVTVGTVEERVRSMMTNLNRPEPGDDLAGFSRIAFLEAHYQVW
jgi:hypothetical protein